MEIISENGKDYLVTYIAKIDNSTIDTNALFMDVQDTVNTIIKKYNNKHKTKDIFIKKGYGYDLQSLLNRYSGDYFSPSFMKNYITNPAMSIVSNFFAEQANDATAIGNTFHAIMEDYYKLPKEQRYRDKLYDLIPSHLAEGQDKEIINEYIQGYYNIKDYLYPRRELDDKSLECYTEHRGRANNLYVKRLGYTVPCAVSYVADRIDNRDGEYIILDYKTGHPKDNGKEGGTFNGYLGSMILYKWAMEQELNIEITKGYLIYPGIKAVTKRYVQLDYSLENEKIMMETVNNFYTDFMKDNRSRQYKFTEDGYFTTEDAKNFRQLMNDNTIWMAKIPIKLYIGETEDSVL
ncbi:MAG: PD-(D/E)XK nuclease family protein [Bacilli bacterium]|nr:PD-(D/E)XK nuclease family protein [Bacilli bacterium]